MPDTTPSPAPYRSGFVTFVGRPNVGKSSLLNALVGRKVSITSDKAQTTRVPVRGVLHRPDAQVVFVDTPGIHKPVSALGSKLNESAVDSVRGVDVVCLVLDATAPFGRGDRFVAAQLDRDAICVVNKVDVASRRQVVEMLAAAGELDLAEYYPVSARTGVGLDALVEGLVARLPEGPPLFPADMVTDVPEAFWVAELVREQLFRTMQQELPYSIATRVTEWDEPEPGSRRRLRVRVEILVERESQKGMVIGKGGSVLKEVGTRARAQLPEGTVLELVVKVDRDWQRRPKAVERLLGLDA